MSQREGRSAHANDYRRLYRTARWLKRRARQLLAEPLCRTCRLAGRTTAATVADHVVPHRGDRTSFYEGELQSLCDVEPFRCHSRVKQREERLGFSPAVDADGFPIDPRHRANLGRHNPGCESSRRTALRTGGGQENSQPRNCDRPPNN